MESYQSGDPNVSDSILSQLPLNQQEMELLAENGFDDVESLRFLDLNTLVAFNISRPQEIFDQIQVLLSQVYEYEEEQPEEDYGEEDKQGETPPEQTEPKQLKQITAALIVQTLESQKMKLSKSGAEQFQKNMKGFQMEQNLAKLTHLHLNRKKISRIGDEMQKYCKTLKVLYLFDNIIQQVDGLGSLKTLVQLSLYNNQISKMEGFDGLVSLKKLYLEKNKLSKLEGLTNCRHLEELYLSQQDIHTDFTFDEYSLAAIAGSLKYLDLSDSRVSESQPLYYLDRLEVLILKRNRIQDFEDQICPMLQTMKSLRQLDLSDNPVNAIPKYRDQIIILTGNNLQEIDAKKVTQQERTYLMQLVQRKQRQVMGGEKKEKGEPSQFEIQGKTKSLHHVAGVGVNANAMIGSTYASQLESPNAEEDDVQHQFYSPLDETKTVLKQKTNIANHSYQNAANLKKRSININANNDFTGAGVSHMPTKHVPSSIKGANIGNKK